MRPVTLLALMGWSVAILLIGGLVLQPTGNDEAADQAFDIPVVWWPIVMLLDLSFALRGEPKTLFAFLIRFIRSLFTSL